MKKRTKIPTTLNDVWKECLRMWAWIDKHIGEKDVCSLKTTWIRENYEKNIYVDWDCFFCRQAEFCDVWYGAGGEDESDCPGVKIDPSFRCTNKEYHYEKEPHKFYLKLRRLNRKRLKGKKS